MHHKVRPPRRGLWAVVQFAVWSALTVAVLLSVTGCKSGEPGQGTTPGPGPTFVRDPGPSPCSRCFERPGLGHAS